MPETARERFREFLLSASQALLALKGSARANAQGMPRMDAVEYLSSALQAYRALDPAGQKQLLAEVVALSQRGLAINDPDQKHTLSHYRGGRTVSALEAACVYYAGVKLLLPGQDPGLDLGREYGLARGLVGEGDS
jgi:hypothetical protein